ncbi:MAG: 1-(5-phosphoribosyl)-5-[(5-phosphoribosylamino)methylideneamino]imidazole-4-carboxamide isomerase [Candidatus Bathyarchaeia archaeon]
MKIFPAVDLMGGRVVRLFQGNPDAVKNYGHLGEPVAVAKKWEDEGAHAIHIVDLDAALGRGNNFRTIGEIVRKVTVPVHVGGGIRSLEVAEKMLNIGVRYIMLGTLAFRSPDIVTRLRDRFGDCVIVAIDHKGGKVMVEGWKSSTDLSVDAALKLFSRLNVKTFLLTSVSRDGTLQGVDADVLSQACKYEDIRIIAAGGVGSLMDLTLLKQIGVYGVVIGKALYEGVFTLKEALKVACEVEV